MRQSTLIICNSDSMFLLFIYFLVYCLVCPGCTSPYNISEVNARMHVIMI